MKQNRGFGLTTKFNMLSILLVLLTAAVSGRFTILALASFTWATGF